MTLYAKKEDIPEPVDLTNYTLTTDMTLAIALHGTDGSAKAKSQSPRHGR